MPLRQAGVGTYIAHKIECILCTLSSDLSTEPFRQPFMPIVSVTHGH